jgi:hypothetical protein
VVFQDSQPGGWDTSLVSLAASGHRNSLPPAKNIKIPTKQPKAVISKTKEAISKT